MSTIACPHCGEQLRTSLSRDARRARVLELVRARPGISTVEVAAAFGGGAPSPSERAAANVHLCALLRAGLVARERALVDGKGAPPYLWRPA